MSTAYQCCGCGHLFPCSDADTHEHEQWLDNMYDRPGDWQLVTHPACPACGSEELISAHLCSRCQMLEPIKGSDFCALCEALEEREEAAAIRRQSREARHIDLLGTLVDIARCAMEGMR